MCHLAEPPRQTQDTLEVVSLSASLGTLQEPQEELAKSQLFTKVWVGLELQLDYGMKTSPSSNFC